MSFTVLYVDDEDIPRLIFEKSFESKYSIFTIESGKDALEKLADLTDQFVVVISDMRMPGMTGVEFIREARQQFDNMECFILTAMENDADIEEAVIENLIKKVFNKPLNVQEIDEAILEATANLS